MLQRRKEMKERLEEIETEMKSSDYHSAEYDYDNEKIMLQENLGKIEEGLNFELDLLQKGMKEFFKNKLCHGLLKDQMNYAH